MSPTTTSGKRVRSRETSCAEVRLPPPRSKKSSAGVRTSAPRTLEPELGEPPHRAVQPTILGRLGGGGQRPRQRVPVHLAGGLGGEHVDHRQPGHQRGGHRVPEQLHGLGLVERGVGRDVAHEELVARSGLAHRGRGPDHARHGQQRRVDLTELDPPAAELDLVVGAATEEQPGRVVHDQVAAAVGPLPAEGRHRRVLLGVLGRVEVASQPDASDDQLTGGTLRDRLPLGIDHGEVPAVERQPDPDRPLAGQLGTAGDDGGLGRAVGVPHLAPRARPAGRASSGGHASPPMISSRTPPATPAATARPGSAPWTPR